jgi:hypothetical protein
MSLSLSRLVRPGGKYRIKTKRLTGLGRGLSGCQCAGLRRERICVEAFRWCEVNHGVESSASDGDNEVQAGRLSLVT